MYSEVFQAQQQYEIMSIELDGFKITHDNANRLPLDFVVETLEYYHSLKNQEFKDPILATINKRFQGRVDENTLNRLVCNLSNGKEDAQRYQHWLLNFLHSYVNEDAKVLRVVIEKYEYLNGLLVKVDSELLFQYANAE